MIKPSPPPQRLHHGPSQKVSVLGPWSDGAVWLVGSNWFCFSFFVQKSLGAFWIPFSGISSPGQSKWAFVSLGCILPRPHMTVCAGLHCPQWGEDTSPHPPAHALSSCLCTEGLCRFVPYFLNRWKLVPVLEIIQWNEKSCSTAISPRVAVLLLKKKKVLQPCMTDL